VKTLSVVGARPNLVKMAPVLAALRRRIPEGRHVLVHTGQHYDREMSEIFLEELGIPEPDHVLGVGSGTHAQQTARAMERLEPVLGSERPDLVLVAGDVNSTLAAALVAVKLGLRIAHVEAGLRSFDRSMPEEINRVVADEVSDLLFVHCEDAIANLRRSGVPDGRIHFVGNTMIDALVSMEPRFRARRIEGLGVDRDRYVLVTLHRPALVDGPLLAATMRRLAELSAELPVVFPVHPRTRARIGSIGIPAPASLMLLDPIGYVDFLALEARATAVLTDSGGVQEETTYLGVPCFTLRDNTERPVTIEHGTNTLLGLSPERIAEIPALLAAPAGGSGGPPELWDGRAAERIAEVVAAEVSGA